MESIQNHNFIDMTLEEIDACIERELEIFRRSQQRLEELMLLSEDKAHPYWKLYREMFNE